MNRNQKQAGMTAIAWLGVIALILMFVLLTLKLLPIYLDSFKVGSVLSDIKDESGIANMTPVMIHKTIMKRLDINMVNSVSKDDIYIDKSGKQKRTVEIDYEVRENIMANIDVVVHFQKVVTIPGP
ncbi:hypothetical protein MNBD_GAMMA24-2274 [hydrothermal vent metagenome]|uniref:DUF4845 domain-containing protein n=1 Tax=hydrothermal vent metagenome TaxID=652676 RepID=A0A3B1C6V0_9ZZZZ